MNLWTTPLIAGDLVAAAGVCVCVSQVQDVWVHREEEELNMS